MDSTEIARLRTDGNLTALADGTEAVSVSVQFQGPLLSLPRDKRKEWLLNHFEI